VAALFGRNRGRPIWAKPWPPYLSETVAALFGRNRGRLSRTIAGTVAQPSTGPDAKPSHGAAVVVACFAVCLYIYVAAVIGRRFQ